MKKLLTYLFLLGNLLFIFELRNKDIEIFLVLWVDIYAFV